MDAADLARWTRFATKGGIGKCTAVQDCIAESPEDLMFLKDDQIVVLMQLPNQAGWFLGYCEGVVGRFQGAHVHFHSKLKRPIMTKRASSSAPTLASTSAANSPVPPGTPSPRVSLALLPRRTDSPQIAKPQRDWTSSRETDPDVLSDPFDLELPPRRSESHSRPGSASNSRPGTGKGRETDSPKLRGLDGAESDGGGGRRRRTRVADDLPGLEMFISRSRSGSRSRVSSLAGDGNSRPNSRGQQLQVQYQSPRAAALDLPPSPQPQPQPSPQKPQLLDVQIKVDVDVVVEVAPPPESVASVPNPEPRILSESPDVLPEAEESSLYDQASLRSSVYSTLSTHSYRSSTLGLGAQPVLAPSASDSLRFSALGRLSAAESDDSGLGMGIGLTMLQDLADEDDEHNEGTVAEEVPPTPKPADTVEGLEQPATETSLQATRNEVQSEESEGKQESAGANIETGADEEEDEDDYWDGGGDIYDDYRYSRYSMMTRTSKRKSGVSMMSKYSVYEPEDVPPIPVEGRARTDSGTSSLPSPTEERRRHVPPPLTLVKSVSSSSVLLSPPTLSPSSTPMPAPAPRPPSPSVPDGGRHTTADFSLSPLLHTNFPSPGTTSSRATSLNGGTPSPSPAPSVASFAGAGPGTSAGAGAASALRQRLETRRGASPTPPPRPASSIAPSMDVDSEGGGIVVEDDESVRVMVVSADDDDALGNAMRGSVQSNVSEMSVESDVTREMREVEAQLASPPPPSSNLPNGAQEPTADRPTTTTSSFPAGATQPLRFQGRRSGPSQEQDRQQQQPQTPQLQQQQLPAPGSHLRPQRSPEQTLFLPHPNAPRPNPAVTSGQRVSTYGMPPVHEQPAPLPAETQHSSLQATLRMAASSRVGPAGVPHRPTIFGKPVIDLMSADGPVAMLWALQPFPPDPGNGNGSRPAGRAAPRRAGMASASPLSQSISNSAPSTPPPDRMGSPASVSSTPVIPPALIPGKDLPQSSSLNVLPRANFLPRVGVARPRSRSFSGFASDLPVKPAVQERASEEGSRPTRAASMQSLKDALGEGAAPPTGPTNRNASMSSSPNRSPHASSPLSLPQNNRVVGTPRTASLTKASPSPLGRPPILSDRVPPSPQSDGALEKGLGSVPQTQSSGKIFGVRQVASVGTIKFDRPESALVSPPTSVLQPVRRNSGPSESSSASTSSPSTAPSAMERLRRISTSSKKHQRTISQQSRRSSSSDLRSGTVSPPPTGENLSSSSSVHRSNSVKSKLSLSHLRMRNSSAKDTLRDVQTPSPSTGPATPVFEFDSHPETVQVQDAEFEMIRPTMPRVSSSEDSMLGRDERPSLQQDARAESPAAASMHSARSPIPSAVPESPLDTPRAVKPVEDVSSVEAHRTRELKWISAMSSVPASQARKSKKIRRLVLEGVPASVRYLVWAHMTDSKSKRIPGVYGQLSKRGKVAASETIERDAVRCFPDQPHLRDPKGPLISLLQTYLTMVPDIEYQTNLALIAGHLLLQSPEEDAFWTFVAMMGLHLRTYFSSKSVQMEADAIVFGKAVEAFNPQIAKKLFVEMSIPPMELCRTWFSSLFATTLPQEYVNRIWDVYFCEGPPFLFRIGLAILFCSRTAIENARDRTSVLSFLARPETLSLLPSDPEDLISLALAVKLKDDDVKKQRVKVEAQLKLQTQLPQRGAPRLVSSISLPRT